MKNRAIYLDSGVAETEQFFDSAYESAKGESAALDSAAIQQVSAAAVEASNLPDSVKAVMDAMPEDQRSRVMDSVLVGMKVFEAEHGTLPTADVITAALQQGVSASKPLDSKGRVMDSVGSTGHHDQISAHPNRIVVAITSAIAEAMPFATYLPTDIGSNEARLGIVSHLAGSAFGGYAQNELMDGINIGKTYLSAERRITLTLDGDRDAATGAVYTTAGGSTALKVLRGRTIILVNGFPVAYESPNTAATVAASPITGTANIAGTDYTVSGTVTVATGAISLAFAPALPAGTVVEAEAFIDYEADTSLTPKIMTQVSTFSLFATPWRAICDQTVDSKTQYGNELGLDLQSENLMAIRNQFSMERHYAALHKLKALALNNAQTYDFDWTSQKVEKTRARIWQDAQAVIGVVDQQMAEDTMDHGITHMYVPKKTAAQLMGLPRDIFEPSGIVARPGIYRIGRLFGRYDVYYTPKGLTETTTASQILCVGRSPQVARCPIVLGDAVAPTYLPLAMDTSMKYQNGFYARNFTSVNPHIPSAKGAALINITNLF
jgi:hypothetical protein